MPELVINCKVLASRLKSNMAKANDMMQAAIIGAANEAGQEIVRRGRADIASAGRFGSRWQEAFNTDITSSKNSITITATMRGDPPVSYWPVFEYGANIKAKNPGGLMWLPFPFASDALGVWPRDYGGELFRRGNVLYAKTGEFREVNEQGDTEEIGDPKYLGVPEVTIPQKFHLRDIVLQVAKELKDYYAKNMKG